MAKRKVVAIVGGMGSGKSYALEFFRGKGFNCVSSDLEYREFRKSDEFLSILGKLGFGSVDDLDKAILSRIGERGFKQAFEALVHPHVMRIAFSKLTDGVNFVEISAPTAENLRGFDAVLYIYAPEDVRRERVRQRNNAASKYYFTTIIGLQPTREEFLGWAQYTVQNDGDIQKFERGLTEICTRITNVC